MPETFRTFLTIYKKFVLGYKARFATILFLMIGVAALSASYVFIIEKVLNNIFISHNTKYLLVVPIAIIIIGILKGLFTYLQTVMLSNTIIDITNDMRLKLYQKFIQMDIAFHNENASGKIISRIIQDTLGAMSGISIIITNMVRELLTVVFLMAAMFFQNWRLSLISMIGTPFIAVPLIKITRNLKSVTSSIVASQDVIISSLDDSIKAIRTVKAYNAESFEIDRIGSIFKSNTEGQKHANKISFLASPISELSGTIGAALVIWYGGMQVISGASTAGSFFAFLTSMVIAYKPLKSLTSMNITIQRSSAAAHAILASLDSLPIVHDAEDAQPISKFSKQIEFDNVSFKYPNTDILAIENLSATIPVNKTIAIVGLSGAGKSTIMNLLLRFYDVTSGSIKIDDIDIRHATIHSLRSQIAYVGQDVQIFNGTVKENIIYASTNASQEDFSNAVSISHVDEFVRNMENGFDTRVGQSGVLLSGGQKQRIAIARAILCNAPILLLDEATSALDNISERFIQSALKKVMSERTSIIIAHRLSTVMNADIIYIMSRGKIIESGNHVQLLSKDGEYTKLYNAGTL